jgi:hypothetical protein
MGERRGKRRRRRRSFQKYRGYGNSCSGMTVVVVGVGQG